MAENNRNTSPINKKELMLQLQKLQLEIAENSEPSSAPNPHNSMLEELKNEQQKFNSEIMENYRMMRQEMTRGMAQIQENTRIEFQTIRREMIEEKRKQAKFNEKMTADLRKLHNKADLVARAELRKLGEKIENLSEEFLEFPKNDINQKVLGDLDTFHSRIENFLKRFQELECHVAFELKKFREHGNELAGIQKIESQSTKKILKNMAEVMINGELMTSEDTVEKEAELIDFYVARVSKGKMNFRMKPTETFYDLKVKIEEKEDVPPLQQRLIFAGKQCPIQMMLKEMGVENGSTVHLIQRRE